MIKATAARLWRPSRFSRCSANTPLLCRRSRKKLRSGGKHISKRGTGTSTSSIRSLVSKRNGCKSLKRRFPAWLRALRGNRHELQSPLVQSARAVDRVGRRRRVHAPRHDPFRVLPQRLTLPERHSIQSDFALPALALRSPARCGILKARMTLWLKSRTRLRSPSYELTPVFRNGDVAGQRATAGGDADVSVESAPLPGWPGHFCLARTTSQLTGFGRGARSPDCQLRCRSK